MMPVQYFTGATISCRCRAKVLGGVRLGTYFVVPEGPRVYIVIIEKAVSPRL
jgi:hypothetical protein